MTNQSICNEGGLESGNRARNFKASLALSGVGVALVTSLASPAHAACGPDPMDADIIICDDTTPNGVAADVDPEIAALAGPDGTLTIDANAEVIAPGGVVNFGLNPNLNLTGTLLIDNAGELGTSVDPVGVNLNGAIADTDSIGTLNNADTGTITGNVSVSNFGGGSTVTNAGAIEGSVTVGGGSTDASGVMGPMVAVAMDIQTTTTDDETLQVGAGATVTVAETGTNTGPIGIVDNGGTINVTIDGAVGDDMNDSGVSITANSGATNNTVEQTTIVDIGAMAPAGNIDNMRTETDTVAGGTVNFTVGATGTVEGDVTITGAGAAVNANIGGTIGTVDMMGAELNPGFVTINTRGTNVVDTDNNTSTGGMDPATTSDTLDSNTDASGAVAVTVTGAIVGDDGFDQALTVFGGSGGITLTVDGATIGTEGSIAGTVLDATVSNTVSTTTDSDDGMGVILDAQSTMTTPSGGDIVITDLGGSTFFDEIFANSGGGDITADLTDTTFGDGTGSVGSQLGLDASGTGSLTDSTVNDDGMGTVVTVTNTNNQTAAGGDVMLTATGVETDSDFDIFTNGGAVTVNLTDVTLGTDGSAALDIEFGGVDTVNSTDVTVFTDPMVMMAMPVTTNSVTTTTSTNVSGDLEVTITDSTIDEVEIDGGSGAVDFTATGSTFGENGMTSGSISITNDATDTSNIVTVTNDGDTSEGTNSMLAVGGDINVNLTDVRVDGNVTATSNGGDIAVVLTDTTVDPEGGLAGTVSVDATAIDTVTVTDMDTTTTIDPMTMMPTQTVVVMNMSTTQTVADGTSTVTLLGDTEVGGVSITSGDDIDFDNDSRIKGDVIIDTLRTITPTNTVNSTTTTDFGATSEVATEVFSTVLTSTQVGGSVDFNNTGIIGDPIIDAIGPVIYTNEETGVILADTAITTSLVRSTTTVDGTTVTTTPVPAMLPAMSMDAPSDQTIQTDSVNVLTETRTGGDIDLTNAGTLGALGINNAGVVFPETAVFVSLNGQSDITVDNSGILVGDLSAFTNGYSRDRTITTDSLETITDFNAADPMDVGPTTVVTSITEMDSTTVNDGAIAVTITGLVSEEGPGLGTVTINTLGGDASLGVNGGTVEGSAFSFAGVNNVL
ncbi:MAG: hypothetical protein AAFR01_00110, partial [Pseudomonadota bacterium]